MSWQDIGYPDPACECACATSPPPPPCVSNPITIDVVYDDPCYGPAYGYSYGIARSSCTFTVYDASGSVLGTLTTGSDGTTSPAHGGSGPLSLTSPVSGGRVSLTGGLPCDIVQPADVAVNVASCGAKPTYTFAPALQPWAICCSYADGTGGPTCHQLSDTITGTVNGYTATLTRSGPTIETSTWSGYAMVPGKVVTFTGVGCNYTVADGTVPVQIFWRPCVLLTVNFPYFQAYGDGSAPMGYSDPASVPSGCSAESSAQASLGTGLPYTLAWNPLYISQTQSIGTTDPFYLVLGWTSITFSAAE